jgi:hypothetical protein
VRAFSTFVRLFFISPVLQIQTQNIGGFPVFPGAANCTEWANQFGETGIRNFPGVPPFRGFEKQYDECLNVRNQFSTMLNYASLVLPATSWNQEKRGE